MRTQLLTFSCVLTGSFLFRKVGASCYYPDGSFPEDYVYVACSGDEFTTCCMPGEGDQCLSNGLCYYPSTGDYGYMFRGACTDKTWNSPNCFQHCKGKDSAGTYDKLIHCEGDKYCCSSEGSTCCNDDTKVFVVASASVIKDLATTTRPFSIETPTFASTTASRSTTTSAGAPTSGSQGAKPTGPESAAASTGTSTATPPTTEEESKGPPKTAMIAGAAGGAAVLIGAIGLVWFLVRRRYKRKMAANANSFPLSSDGFQKLPDKSPRPIEVPAPLHSPAPPYQPPPYQAPPPQHNAVEIDNSYLAPGRNQWGQPVYEAPAQPYRRI